MRSRAPALRTALGWWSAWLVLLGLFVGPAPVTAADATCDGVRMPDQLQVAGKTLLRNGMGIRRATFLKVHVYVAALYVERPSRRAADLLRADQVRSLSLRFVRDVTRDEMVGALEDGIAANAPRQADTMKKEMQALARMLPPLREGNELTFRHVPGQGLSVLGRNKALGTIANDAFAALLFRIWLGAEPPDAGLKAGLLGGSCA